MRLILGAALALVVATPLSALGQSTIHVANNGLDSAGCGTAPEPCRSISAGIAAAVDGDTVMVRPGRYGDLNGDDALGGPGEETGNYNGAVYINKRVKVLSTEGAGATIIRGISSVPIVVYLDVSGAQFGERSQGFTVYGANSFGVSNNNMSSGKIAGNIAQGMAVGFYIVAIGGEVEVSHNSSIGYRAAGIVGATAADTVGATFIHHNTLIGDGSSTGIQVSAIGPHRVVANRVSHNQVGIDVGVGPSRIAQNVVTDSHFGIAYSGQCLFCSPAPAGTPLIVRNSLVGNRFTALWVSHLADYPITLRQNNLFGNGDGGGCAISTSTTQIIDARQNFWGAATGPSFTDPADAVCSTHDVVRTVPFATAEIPVN
jgi:hypothetical protein